jgi:hypothetical protein
MRGAMRACDDSPDAARAETTPARTRSAAVPAMTAFIDG